MQASRVVAAGNFGRLSLNGSKRLRNCGGAGERSLCDHRGRHEDDEHASRTDDLIAS